MIDDCPPHFQASCKGCLYQIYVTSSDMLFVKLGSGKKYFTGKRQDPNVAAAAFGGGLVGGMAAMQAAQRQAERDAQNRRIEEDGERLAGYSADTIRSLIDRTDSGFEAPIKDLANMRIEEVSVNQFLGVIGGETKQALVFNHRRKGELEFVFRGRADVVTALYEIDLLLGDDLEIDLPIGRYKKSIAKYRKLNKRAGSADTDDASLPYVDDQDDDSPTLPDANAGDAEMVAPRAEEKPKRILPKEEPRRRQRASRRDEDDEDDDFDGDWRNQRRSKWKPWVIGGGVGVLGILALVLIVAFASGPNKPRARVVQPNGQNQAPEAAQPDQARRADGGGQPKAVVKEPALLLPVSFQSQSEEKPESIRHIAFSGQPANIAAVFTMKPIEVQATRGRVVGNGVRCDVEIHDLASQKRLGGFQVPYSNSVWRVAVSPDGKTLALGDQIIGRSSTWTPVVHLFSLPDGQPIIQKWEPDQVTKEKTPAKVDPSRAREEGFNVLKKATVGVVFLDGKRLLTVQAGGSAVVWSLPGLEKILTINPLNDSEKNTPILRCFLTVRNKEPTNFGCSADRRIIALHTGRGFSLFNTTDGKLLVETAALEETGRVIGVGALAFSNDGKRMAVEYTYRSPPQSDVHKLACFNVETGKIMTASPLETVATSPEGLGWWGDRYLIVGTFDGRTPRVFDLDHGVSLREFDLMNVSRLTMASPDGRLWYFAGRSKDSPGRLAAVDAPAEISSPTGGFQAGKGERWTFTENGIAVSPDQR